MTDRIMKHKIFISYSSRDKAVAESVCAAIESHNVVCWIAPRDIVPGALYGEAILDAIQTVQLMVLILSKHANHSPQVMREVERAGSKGIPIIPFLIDVVPLSKAIEFFVSTHHWLDASEPPLERHLDKIVTTVVSLLHQLEANMRPSVATFASTVENTSFSSPPKASKSAFHEWKRMLERGSLSVDINTSNPDEITSVTRVVSEALHEKGFSKTDEKKASVALGEMLTNVANYVSKIDPTAKVDIQVDERSFKVYYVSIKVRDSGKGFDLETALLASEERLAEGQREHGLLRCFRLGTSFEQLAGPCNTLVWETCSTSDAQPSMFDKLPSVVPVIYDYDTNLLRIGHDMMPLNTILKLAINPVGGGFQAFAVGKTIPAADTQKRVLSNTMKLAFEPLRRLHDRTIVYHVTGAHNTLFDNPVKHLTRYLFDYVSTEMPGAQLVVFADAEKEDNDFLRLFCSEHSLSCFESFQACATHLESRRPKCNSLTAKNKLWRGWVKFFHDYLPFVKK